MSRSSTAASSFLAVTPLVVAACMLAPAPGIEGSGGGIVNGEEAARQYRGVGTLMAGSRMCTATRVSQWIAITAYRCVQDAHVSEIWFGQEDPFVTMGGDRPFTPVVYRSRAMALYYDITAFDTRIPDIVAVELEHQDWLAQGTTGPAYETIRDSGMGEELIGRGVTMVGFGSTGSTARDWGRKRSGDSIITEVDEAKFSMVGGYSLATSCNGDSGGPVFLDGQVAGVIIGVVRSPLGDCRGETEAVRVDPFASVIRAAIACSEGRDSWADAGRCWWYRYEMGDNARTPDDAGSLHSACVCDSERGACDTDDTGAPCPCDAECSTAEVAGEEEGCDCDTSWDCDHCWCEPASECDDDGDV